MSETIYLKNVTMELTSLTKMIIQFSREKLGATCKILHQTPRITVLELQREKEQYYVIYELESTVSQTLAITVSTEKPNIIPEYTLKDYVKELKYVGPTFNAFWAAFIGLPFIFLLIVAFLSPIIETLIPWFQCLREYRASMISGAVLSVIITSILYQIHVNLNNENKIQLENASKEILQMIVQQIEKIEVTPTKRVICWKCYAENPPSVEYCQQCGAKLK